MKTQFGELVTGDFEENTLTIEIDGEMTIQAGKYALVPIDDYNQLVKNCDLADVGGNEVALCRCSEDETTGWIELKCCNICGKPQEQ